MQQFENGADFIDVNAGVFVGMEKERYDALMPIIAGSDYKVVALCMSDAGMPETADARMAITKGLDGAIVNPLDKKMMAAIVTAETLAGKDEWCAEYLQAYRQKRFEF